MQHQEWCFPDFSQCCPLCSGKNCAVKIGTYKRSSIIIHFVVYYNFPIQRWLCQRLGKAKGFKHKTFSLLPESSIPYHKYDTNVLFETATHTQNTNKEKAKDHICEKIDIVLEDSQIQQFQQLTEQAYLKIVQVSELSDAISKAKAHAGNKPLSIMIHLINTYRGILVDKISPQSSSIEKLSADFFYHYQNTPYMSRDFLFGTCSQRRIRG